MSNESKMTLEEHIVQTLKGDHLMKLVGDEDVITELVKRAINEALYQPQKVKSGAYGYETKDSPVVSAARKVVEDAAKSVFQELVAELVLKEPFRQQIKTAMIASIPHILMTTFRGVAEDQARFIAFEELNNLKQQMLS